MRGKHCDAAGCTDDYRITPAGAGKTLQPLPTRWNNRDHPRRCGENNFTYADIGGCHGSPPQVRGKLSLPSWIDVPTRITPAGAGKTRRNVFVRPCHQDHPRRCGENLSVLPCRGQQNVDHPRRCGENYRQKTILIFALGSPPQVRGKQAKSANEICRHRITPAGAGKTFSDL